MKRIQLQRLLETRRTLLRKEQAMAFARSVVAGFEKENIDDLICFADAYGAARLRYVFPTRSIMIYIVQMFSIFIHRQ